MVDEVKKVGKSNKVDEVDVISELDNANEVGMVD